MTFQILFRLNKIRLFRQKDLRKDAFFLILYFRSPYVHKLAQQGYL